MAIDSRGSTSDADGVVMLRNEGGAVVVGTAIAAGRLQHEQLVTLRILLLLFKSRTITNAFD